MPIQNQFRHQTYDTGRPTAPFEILRPAMPSDIDSPESQQQLHEAGDAFRKAGVTAIYLLHGTFVGADASGWIRKLRRLWPYAGNQVEANVKRLLDTLMADAGNYTQAYAQRLQQSLSPDLKSRIPVHLCVWSSENHHIGRADGAVRFLSELLSYPPGSRIQIWSHSHGGNVMALLTNLIAADEETRERFFTACRCYYCWPWTKHVDLPAWKKAIAVFSDDDQRSHVNSIRLDMVTFGTPIRYGWDRGGYDHLLHFVNHRSQNDQEPYAAVMPKKFEDVMNATGGDYIHQFAVAGSNLPPGLLSWRASLANRRLSGLVQGNVGETSIAARVTRGLRVANDGLTLLVDYQDNGPSFSAHLAGHAVYTREKWMAFHAAEIAQRFYGDP
jgi:hypothetical protein